VQVAVISDTHMPRGARSLPARCVELLRSSATILHAGDFMLEEVLEQIEALGPPVYAVHGNVDSIDLRHRLPERRVVELGAVRIGMVHNPGQARHRLELLRMLFPDVDAVVFGHTHMPEHRAHDGFQIFNPGSPTERRRAPVHTMGLAEIGPDGIAFRHVELT
jgi:putative phosphoesterase